MSATNSGLQEQVVSQEGTEIKRYYIPLRSVRGIPPKWYDLEYEAQRLKYPIIKLNEGNLSHTSMTFNIALYSTEIPKTVEQALDSEHSRKAKEDELDALRKNGTWEKCNLPKWKKVVGCKWVFTIKYREDGSIERYKARLVTKGYIQTYCFDYSETFSPVVKINTIRVLFSITTKKD